MTLRGLVFLIFLVLGLFCQGTHTGVIDSTIVVQSLPDEVSQLTQSDLDRILKFLDDHSVFSSVSDKDLIGFLDFLLDTGSPEHRLDTLVAFVSRPHVLQRLQVQELGFRIQKLILERKFDYIEALSTVPEFKTKLNSLVDEFQIPLGLMRFCLDYPHSEGTHYISALYSMPTTLPEFIVDHIFQHLLFGSTVSLFDAIILQHKRIPYRYRIGPALIRAAYDISDDASFRIERAFTEFRKEMVLWTPLPPTDLAPAERIMTANQLSDMILSYRRFEVWSVLVFIRFLEIEEPVISARIADSGPVNALFFDFKHQSFEKDFTHLYGDPFF